MNTDHIDELREKLCKRIAVLMMRYFTDNKLAPQAISDGLQSGWDRLHKGQITTK